MKQAKADRIDGADYGWCPAIIYLPRRGIGGDSLWGGVMERRVNGVRQYRAETSEEAAERWADNQW